MLLSARLSRARLLSLTAAAVGALALTGAATAPADALGGMNRGALIRPRAVRPLALWGSSSMAGGLAGQGTAQRVDIHDQLARAMQPVTVHQFAVGGQTSRHTAILRGAATPTLTFPAGYAGGRGAVTLETDASPQSTFRLTGTVGGAVHGTLSADGTRWFFEADPGAAVTVPSGPFLSDDAAVAADCRHLVWTGKNNILEPERVLRDVEQIRALALDATADNLVLGQWVNAQDADSTPRRDGVAAVNDAQRATYGDHFVDILSLLTTPEGLACAPVLALRLLDRSDVREDIAAGMVPRVLQGDDGMHLNGWGNLIVSHALIERMHAVGWI